jgi:protein O-mannosyl-transferase
MPNESRPSNEAVGSRALATGVAPGDVTEPAPRGPERVWLLSALLVAATFVVYLPVWRAGFIWDDDTFVWRNPLIRDPGGLFRLWFTTAAPDYFPLTSTTLWLEWRLWGANPLGYHLMNVLLHALSAVLLWRVLKRLRIPGAALAAAIFAVHPVNVASVAWITERKNTLAMFFYLSSLLFYLHSEDTRETRMENGGRTSGLPTFSILHPPSSLLYCLSLLAFACALLSKTAVAPMPLVLLGLAWWQRGRLELEDVCRSIPFFALAAATGFLTLWFQYHRPIGQSIVGVRTDSFWSRLAGAGWAIWFYLYKALRPVHLSFVYPRWRIDATRALSYVPVLLVAAAPLVCWRYRQRWGKPLLLGLGYFVIMLLPVLGFLNICFMGFSFVANHWQYFAIIGPIVLTAAAVTLAGGFGCQRQAWLAPAVGGALVLALGILTWQEARTYTDLKTLWTTTIARNPAAEIAHNDLGNLLLQQGQAEQAITHLRQAIVLQPEAAYLRYNLGSALFRAGRVDEALVQLQRAVELEPGMAPAHENLGAAFLDRGRVNEAIAHLQKAVELQPTLASPHFNLGGALLQAGRVAEAIAQLQRALQLQPQLAPAHVSLANALLRQGQTADALAHLQKAVELQPDLADAHYNLANALLQQGRTDEALAHFQKTLALQPGFAPAHNGLANALLQQGRVEEALAHYRAALSLEPRFAEAHLNLANLLLQRRQFNEAILHFQTALQIQPNHAGAHNNFANALLVQGRVDEAIPHFQQALQLQPNLAEAHNGLANALLPKGRAAEAVTHYEAALATLPNHPYLLNNLAWVLATCPDASVRNGARAVELARQADQLSGGKDPGLLGTLAAAYAEAGRFTDAIATAQRALDLAAAQTNATRVEELRARLGLYRAGVPFRDTVSTNAAPH